MRDHQRRGLALKRGAGDVRRFADLGETLLCDSIFAGRDPTASQVAHAAETEVRIEQAMRQLDERYREVIHLRAFCEMSHREIAETMGLPTENTANLLFLRARDKLRRILERRT